MAKAKKLPSGNWRIQVSFTDDFGVKHRASFTESTARQAEAKAAMWSTGMLQVNESKKHPPLEEALDEYLETCRVVGMSPATVRGYTSLRNSAYEELLHRRVDTLTVRDLQLWINARSKQVSPKTVRNSFTLLQTVLKQHQVRIDFATVRLPKPQRTEIDIPSDSQVAHLLDLLYNDSDMYLAVSFAALMGLRRSEICGLTWSDIKVKNGVAILSINKALVMGENGEYAEKPPKTAAGRRDLVIPAPLYEEIKRRRNLRPNIVGLTPNTISIRFTKAAKAIDMPSRFHGLRHYHASVMLREGVPEKYIVADMGHSSFDMVKMVYGHVMAEKQSAIHEAMETHCLAILNVHEKVHTG